jgi:cytochrome c-type biogenesis protein CcmE
VRAYWKFVVPALIAVVVMVLIGFNLTSSLVYFNTPTELRAQDAGGGRMRLGGQVVPGSVTDSTDGVIFDVTDGRTTVPVIHSGAPQQLFQEGIGVVVEGTWDGSAFHSDTMLVKHEETYRTEDGSTYDPDHPYGEDSDGT